MNFHTVNIKKGKEKEKREFPHCQKLCPCSWEQFGYWLCNLLATQNVKKTNPGISFTEVGRVLGEKWKKMSGMRNIFRLVSSFQGILFPFCGSHGPIYLWWTGGPNVLNSLSRWILQWWRWTKSFCQFQLTLFGCHITTHKTDFFYFLFSLFVLRSRGERALWSQGSAR